MLPRIPLLLVFTLGLAMGPPAEAEVLMPQTFFANGGGPQGSSGYLLQGSIGQAVIGLAAGSGTIGHGGFWFSPLLFSSGVEPPAGEPATRFWMSPPRPNPFRRVTALAFAVPHRCRIVIKIYDVSGRERRVLLDEERDAGTHWVRVDDRGLASGVYFCRMTAERFARTERLVLLR
jgi:hypothetical protein